MPFFTSSLDDYKNYLLANLPEYKLLYDTAIPDPPAVIVLMQTSAAMKYGTASYTAYATRQPTQLAFRDKKRLGQIKHYKEKRDKIIAYLTNDCPRKGLVLKSYSRWDRFTVGMKNSDVEDAEYEHLAKLKDDTAKANSGFMFSARRFFGKTTPDQKKALIEQYMSDHCADHVLVHFEHNNLFFIANKGGTTGFGSETGDYQGIFHFQSANGTWIDVQGIMLTSYSQLTKFCTDLTGPASSLWNSSQIAAMCKRYATVIEATGLSGATEFRKILQEVHESMEVGVAHDVRKSVKEALFGKHSRTHPVRAVRMGFSNLFAVVKAALPSILKDGGFAAAQAVATTVMDKATTVSSTASTGGKIAIGEKAVPQWVQDIGLSPSEDELNAEHWKKIQDHIDSLEKWELKYRATIETIKSEKRSVVTCQQMNDLLRFYAKIQFHIDGLLECYAGEVAELNKVAMEVATVKSSLSAGEDVFVRNAALYLNKAVLKNIKTRNPGTAVDIFARGNETKVFTIQNLRTTDANLDSFLSANPILRNDSEKDNDQAEIEADDRT